MNVVEVGIGFMVLLAGRPAYWTFVGGVAFLIGESISASLAIFSPTWNDLIISLLCAVAGVMLTFLFHRWTARVAALVAGGYLIYNLPVALGAHADLSTPFFFALAGLAAFGLLLISFDFGLVVVSSLLAVTLILKSFRLPALDEGVMFFIFLLLGLIVQYLVMQYARPSPD